jgi:phosphoglucomutase
VADSDRLYRLWSQDSYFDLATRQELVQLAGETPEIEDRFYKYLEFGTGGLRGVLGAGTNRINRYTVRHATQGLAQCIAAGGQEACQRGVVIAFDSRHRSSEFALEAALTLNASSITAYLWESLRPTPMLSYAVRELGALAGIVITASHNPPQYNGCKVYWEDGGQVPPERAAAIYEQMQQITTLTTLRPMAEGEARKQGLLRDVPQAIDRSYYERVGSLVGTDAEARQACRILYTPLHGSGNIPVRRVLDKAGFRLSLVAAQVEPDPDFPTVGYPNPEEAAVFTLALQQAEREKPDLILATDPDGDRLGAMALDREGGYRLLTGNQIGAVLVDYLLSTRSEGGALPTNGVVLKSIATSNMIRPLCQAYGVELIDTHTGFKFIGDKIREYEETRAKTFLFGFEESYGYLGAPFVRDKDAVMAALLIADAAAYHKAAGRTLFDALERIWQRCGHFVEELYNKTLPGREGQEQIAALMAHLRRKPLTQLGGAALAFCDDYQSGLGTDLSTGRTYPLSLGRANVLHYRFADGGFVMVRPSGTEPKLKVYFSVCGTTSEESACRLMNVKQATLEMMGLTELPRE